MAFDIASILGGNVLDGIKGILGTFITDPTEKLKAQEAAQALLAQQGALIEQSYQKEIEAKQAIMVAELNQEDKYTKRGRPTIIYAGLVFICINYVVFPFIAAYTSAHVPVLALPDNFWLAWGGVVSAYVLGRTCEKQGLALPFTKPIPDADPSAK